VCCKSSGRDGDDVNYSETLAAHVTEKVLPGVKVRIHDTGSEPGQYDFDLLIDGEPIGAMEVTSDVVEFSAHFRAILARNDYRLPTALVKLQWLLFVRSRPVTKEWLAKLESQCDSLLSELEAASIVRFSINTDHDARAVRLLGQLGVEQGEVVGDEKPEIILTEFNADPWIVSPQHALEACARAVAQQDNISKLVSAKRDQRHLFVWIDPATSGAAWWSLNDTQPAGGLLLPEAITHIWAATSTRDNGIICWVWDRKTWVIQGPFDFP